MWLKNLLSATITLLVIPSIAACGSGGSTAIAQASTASSAGPTATAVVPTDYSVAANWLARPTTIDKPVDVFYLSPTEYVRKTPSDPIVGPIDDPGMVAGDKVAFTREATAFAPVANIYTPYYRQADAASRAALPQAQQDAIVAGAPTQDGIAAFDYYITHDNGGRPFFLAGHSLGSNVLANLLSSYMPSHPDVYRRMIAAYIVGYSITPDYLAANPHLRFATGPSDTGVVVSWNTEAPTIGGPNPVLLPNGLAINPITWTRDETEATADQNLGSIALNADGTAVVDGQGNAALVLGLADARVDTAKGVVIASTPSVAQYSPGGGGPSLSGVFHVYDIPFYYFDLRANAADRAAHFLATK